ncbi:hypothetical protein SUGI_0473270 [Cryptomeria japonica]|nr:hypothetical protein SUGI_0473270 [Cryptomeria japonica]
MGKPLHHESKNALKAIRSEGALKLINPHPNCMKILTLGEAMELSKYCRGHELFTKWGGNDQPLAGIVEWWKNTFHGQQETVNMPTPPTPPSPVLHNILDRVEHNIEPPTYDNEERIQTELNNIIENLMEKLAEEFFEEVFIDTLTNGANNVIIPNLDYDRTPLKTRSLNNNPIEVAHEENITVSPNLDFPLKPHCNCVSTFFFSRLPPFPRPSKEIEKNSEHRSGYSEKINKPRSNPGLPTLIFSSLISSTTGQPGLASLVSLKK